MKQEKIINKSKTIKQDLFKNTFRARMPLTNDYVLHSVFGRDTEESKATLIEILNIAWWRKYDSMKKIIVVSIINGTLFSELKPCHNIFDVRERQTGLLLSDRLEFHFLELDKISGEKPVAQLTEIERLAAYLKYAGDEEHQDYVQEILSVEEDMAMTESAYRKLMKDEVEYERMEARMKYRLQYNTDMSLARKEGLELCCAEGETAATLKLAKALKSEGVSVAVISKTTGLAQRKSKSCNAISNI